MASVQVGFEIDLLCIQTHKPFSGSLTYPLMSTPYCRSPNMPVAKNICNVEFLKTSGSIISNVTKKLLLIFEDVILHVADLSILNKGGEENEGRML